MILYYLFSLLAFRSSLRRLIKKTITKNNPAETHAVGLEKHAQPNEIFAIVTAQITRAKSSIIPPIVAVRLLPIPCKDSLNVYISVKKTYIDAWMSTYLKTKSYTSSPADGSNVFDMG